MITTYPIPEARFQEAFQVKMDYLDDEPLETFRKRYITHSRFVWRE